jgi:serine/threonine protein kinase/tetratricopeptide (TPR) repeat protein
MKPVLRVLDAYLAHLEAGRCVAPRQLLAEHPEFADQLQGCLEVLNLAQSVARPPFVETSQQDSPELGPQLGDYQIIRQIGRGGMGIVYEAQQLSLARPVALKVLPLAGAIDPRQLRRFRVEAQAAAQLHHTNIVPVYAVGCERGVHYYAMQYVEGKSLADLIRELRQLEGREPAGAAPPPTLSHEQSLASRIASGQFEPATGPPASDLGQQFRAASSAQIFAPVASSSSARDRSYFRTVASLGIQAAEALEHAHQEGTVHRDIKPANLMVDVRGHLWVTDFGLARLQDDAGLTLSGDLVGTIRYMSPEQAIGHRSVVDQRSDIYSLGVTLYELVTLEPAFGGSDRRELLRRVIEDDPRPLRSLTPAAPRELETIIQKTMAKEPKDRYLTAQELADDLRRFLEYKPIRAKRPRLTERVAKWGRRHAAAVLSSLVLLMVASVGLTIATLVIWKEQRQTRRAYEAEALLRWKARRAVDEMYGQVAEQLLTEKPDMEKVRREFLEKALVHFEEFAVAQDAGPAMRHQAAKAVQRVGEIERRLGHHSASERAYRQAIALLEKLVELRPKEPLYRNDLLTCHETLGFALSDTGRLEEAESHVRCAVAMAEELAESYPDDHRQQRTLIRVLNNLDTVLVKEGKLWDRKRTMSRARDLAASLAEAYPDEPGNRNVLGCALVNLAEVFEELGRSNEAESLTHSALEIRRRLVEEFPSNATYKFEVSRSHFYIAEIARRHGLLREAECAVRQAVNIVHRLASEFPNIAWYTDFNRETRTALGQIVAAQGRLDEAEPILRRCVAELEEQVADKPRQAEKLAREAEIHVDLGSLLLEEGKSAESRQHLVRARDLWTQATAAAPEQATIARPFALSLADCLQPELRDPAKAVLLARKVTEQSPESVPGWSVLGLALYRSGDWKAATQALRKAIEPGSRGTCRDWFVFAMALCQAGGTDKDQARAWYARAVTWMEQKTPKDPNLKRIRCECAKLLGIVSAPAAKASARNAIADRQRDSH